MFCFRRQRSKKKGGKGEIGGNPGLTSCKYGQSLYKDRQGRSWCPAFLCFFRVGGGDVVLDLDFLMFGPRIINTYRTGQPHIYGKGWW